MTRLRKMVLEDLQRRDYSQDTIRCYLRAVEDFSRRFNRPPDCLGPRHIREYQAELLHERKLSPGTVTTRLAALRIFYVKTAQKGLEHSGDSLSEKRHRLPTPHFQAKVHQECTVLGPRQRRPCDLRKISPPCAVAPFLMVASVTSTEEADYEAKFPVRFSGSRTSYTLTNCIL